MKDRCTVDCSGIDDCDACIDKDGCGWVPVLGECQDCAYNYSYEHECWDKWWDRDLCPFDHCYRMDTCEDCLVSTDCSWWYLDLECRPGDSCPLKNVDCFSLKDDITGSDIEVAEFCDQGLDDPACMERNECYNCVGDDKCGWLHREGEEGPVCLPASICEIEINCYTSKDFGKVSSNADATEFCDVLISKYQEDAETCMNAQGCRDCVIKELEFFDRCKWFHRLESVETTLIYYDCGLECHDIESYDGCIEQPETCPCVPEATCEECLRDGCGYWAEDDPKYLWNSVPLPPGGDDLIPRCYHFCRNDEYEYDLGDENCYEFDESLKMTPDEVCADLDACEGLKCLDCYAQQLPSDPEKTCIWLRDRFCAPKWACGASCDSDEDTCPCDPCDPNPCTNGGSCVDLGDDEFECACPPTFAGKTCDIGPSDAFVYNEYAGACRKDSEGTDKGSNGDDYNLYKRKDNRDVDLTWCKGKCDGNECTGIEYRDTGDDSQCEVWYNPIRGFEGKGDHLCLVKTYRRYGGACRKDYEGDSGKSGEDYELYKTEGNPKVDYRWCKDKCDDDSSCFGIEYRDVEENSQCEVWHKPIQTFEEKDNHNCLVKVARAHYYSCHYSGGCRINEDQTGKGSNGAEYDLYKDKTYDWCKQQCSLDQDCTGFEHRWEPEDDMQCELWTAEIKSREYKRGLDCCIKRQGFSS